MKPAWVSLVILSILLCGSATAGPVSFERIVVDRTFRAEGVATGDVNHDGKLDILSGDVWYAGPDFKKMGEVRKVGSYDGTKGYSNCFANFAQDVNHRQSERPRKQVGVEEEPVEILRRCAPYVGIPVPECAEHEQHAPGIAPGVVVHAGATAEQALPGAVRAVHGVGVIEAT